MLRNIKNKFFNTKLYLWRYHDSSKMKLKTNSVLDLRKLKFDDIDIVASNYASSKLITERLNQGYTGYWVKNGHKCVHLHWYARGKFDVYDIRGTVLLPYDSRYLFDVFTDSNFRKQGIFRSALMKSIVKEKMAIGSSIFAFTRVGNVSANAFFFYAGFKKVAKVSMLQIPPFRRYLIYSHGGKQSQNLLMKIKNKPVLIDLNSLKFDKL